MNVGRRAGRRRSSAASTGAILLAASALAAAEAAADGPILSGSVATDFRASLGGPIAGSDWPAAAGPEDRGDLIWNINQAEFRLRQRLGPHIRYEAHLRLNFDGMSLAGQSGDRALGQLDETGLTGPAAGETGDRWRSVDATLDDLFNGWTIDPFWVESDAAYVEVRDLFPGFDMVFGRQVVTWGASDRFRPTNMLNPDDLWDPLRFGITQANEMVRLLYNPTGNLILEAVVVPVFRPARLPRTAAATLADPSAAPPFLDMAPIRAALGPRETMDELGLLFDDTFAFVDVPDASLENVQIGARATWRSGDFDMSLSFYRGFDDFPRPAFSTSNVAGGLIDNYVLVRYPRITAFGFDLAGSIGFLDDAGFRVEGAVIHPESMTMTVDMPMFLPDVDGRVLDGRPYFKATVGIDYTFTRDIFVLAMLVRGFADEAGPLSTRDYPTEVTIGDGDAARRIPLAPQGLADYVVAGADFKFLNGKLLLRVFGIAALDIERFCAVAYPLLQWNPWGAMELEAGGYVLFGEPESKFGQAAAGSSMAFLRSRVRF